MNRELLQKLSEITDEEKEILSGHRQVNRALYYADDGTKRKENIVDSARVLTNGRLIDIRPNVRFVRFPAHTHNYVEFVYMAEGSTTHIIDGHQLTLKEGDLLFLNQHATQEILPAGRYDVAINFMILPSFFDTAFRMMGNAENPLRRFIISCLTDKAMGGNYLYFDVSDDLSIQNLMENLIYIMQKDPDGDRTIAQTTMGLLFLHLLHSSDRIHVSRDSYEQKLMIHLLAYIEDEYKAASLSAFAENAKTDVYTLSRLIKKSTGQTFTGLLQDKRLEKACFLLKNTKLSFSDISAAVGYENASFFHRLFVKEKGCTPREYRLQGRSGAGETQAPETT